jgi:phospholipase C
VGHYTLWIQTPEATSEAPLRVTVTETLQGSFCLLPAAYEMVRAQRADQPKISTKMTILKTVYLAAFAAAASFGIPTFGQETAEHHPGSETAYPIKNLVVIFQENISFDHYFATYPVAANPAGEPKFVAKPGTPTVNGLTPDLITQNQNSLQPQRLDRSHAATADQNHDYPNEQLAFDHGLMDKFPENTGTPEADGSTTVVMDYFDGNTVTALWNYAQNFALNDNSFGSTPGPSTPGAIEVVSGQTHGASPEIEATVVDGTAISDSDPSGDSASASPTFAMTGTNIGDLLNAKNITWGWFEGGFDNPSQTHIGANGSPKADYIPHHEPFQYYPQTANPRHKPPTSVKMIGKTDQANHQYDITWFWQALSAHNLPAVSYLKAPGYQDGHPGYSDPLLEQQFIVQTVNQLMLSPEWKNMAIIIAYDDSDGWYDHVMPPTVNESQTAYDFLTAPGTTGGESGANEPLGGFQGRYSFGPRMPFLVISPFAKENFVDHTVTDQSSIVHFIEDNWNLGRIGNFSFDQYSGTLLNLFDFGSRCNPGTRQLILDPTTGEPVNKGW